MKHHYKIKKENEKLAKKNIIGRKKDELSPIKEIKILTEDSIVFIRKEFKNTKRINRLMKKEKSKKLSINVFI